MFTMISMLLMLLQHRYALLRVDLLVGGRAIQQQQAGIVGTLHEVRMIRSILQMFKQLRDASGVAGADIETPTKITLITLITPLPLSALSTLSLSC